MKLKTKIMISFCIILFVPILLSAAVLFSFQRIQIRAIEQTYGVEDEDYSYFSNAMQLMSRFTQKTFEELSEVAESDPARFEDEGYLGEMNLRLREKNSYLVVRKGGELIYSGMDIAAEKLLNGLPQYGGEETDPNTGVYVDGEQQTLIKQIDFVCADGAPGSVFIITILEEPIPEIRNLMSDALIAILLILLSTACMLTVWIYTSMVTPIRRLRTAAQNIKNGNLDFTVTVESDDEIGELCRGFEEMRQRLKDNAEEKLSDERENRMLISNIAHDLRTPITAVKGYAEGLIDGVADTPEKQERYLRTIYNKANEMDTLINELTLYAKIDTNRIPYNFVRMNVTEYFNDCVEEIGLDLEAKGIGLSYSNYVDEDVRIIADPEQLKRVVNNIVGNSVKYLDKQRGMIHVRVKDVGDFVQVEIEDNGRGIAARDLPYIFDRFYRADASRNSMTGGSGIGLSIARKIVEDHGGKIWATSKESIGTVMYFVVRKYQEVFNE